MSTLTDSVGLDAWPNSNDSDYGHGGLCRLEKEPGLQKLVMKLTVDEHFYIHGGTYAAPEPLRTTLQELIDQIRSEVDQFRRKNETSNRATHMTLSPSMREDGMAAAVPRSLSCQPEQGQERDDGRVGAEKPLPPTLRAGAKRSRRVSKQHARSSGKDDMAADSCSEDRETDKDERDDELHMHTNLRQIALSDGATLNDFYYAAFKRIQQTHCRQIAQALVKVVHPKKQTRHPYNGARRNVSGSGGSKKPAGEGKTESGDTRPHWWPMSVPHREPAHLKTPERMGLLMHILCKLRKTPDTGPRGTGVCVEDLRAATDEMKADKLPKKAKSWLAHIYEVRCAQEQYEDGCMRELVSVHMPSNKRVNKKKDDRSRVKAESDASDDGMAQFEDDVDMPTSRRMSTEETFVRFTRSGEIYHTSESEDDRRLSDDDSSSDSYSTKASDKSLAFSAQDIGRENQAYDRDRTTSFSGPLRMSEGDPRTWDAKAPFQQLQLQQQQQQQQQTLHQLDMETRRMQVYERPSGSDAKPGQEMRESHGMHFAPAPFSPTRMMEGNQQVLSSKQSFGLPPPPPPPAHGLATQHGPAGTRQPTSGPFWTSRESSFSGTVAHGEHLTASMLPPISPTRELAHSLSLGRHPSILPPLGSEEEYRRRESIGAEQALHRPDAWSRPAVGLSQEGGRDLRLAPLHDLLTGPSHAPAPRQPMSQHGRYGQQDQMDYQHHYRDNQSNKY